MFDEALPVCIQFRVINTCIHINTMLGDFQAAVSLVADELERELVEAIQSGKTLRVSSIDRVGDDPLLKKPYETVLMAFDLLSKTPESGPYLEKLWRFLFLAFQLPLFLAKNSNDIESNQAMTLFFSFFVVAVLSKTSPDFVLDTLKRDFCSMDSIQYKNVFGSVFKYLDYQKMLSSNVQSLLLEDCLKLYHESLAITTKAATVFSPKCDTCLQPITGAGGVGMLVFECGHCYHNDLTCGGHKTCPKCRGELVNINPEKGKQKISSRNKLMRRRQIQRVEYGLKKHYGKDQDITQNGNYVFFLPESIVPNPRKIELEIPEDLPDECEVALEL